MEFGIEEFIEHGMDKTLESQKKTWIVTKTLYIVCRRAGKYFAMSGPIYDHPPGGVCTSAGWY